MFVFNDAGTTEIYPLSLHDALPLSRLQVVAPAAAPAPRPAQACLPTAAVLAKEAGMSPTELRVLQSLGEDRKSTRLNSSHANISYAVFCLKKKIYLSSSSSFFFSSC